MTIVPLIGTILILLGTIMGATALFGVLWTALVILTIGLIVLLCWKEPEE